MASGTFVMQPTGYRAFVPRPLPPDPPIQYTEQILTALSRADRALGRLDGITIALPDANLFVSMYVRKEAVLSSQIEGTQSSLSDLLEIESQIERGDGLSDVGDLVNYVGAMNFGLERLEELPVSLRLIREIHARLLHGVRGGALSPGEFRTSQNWIGPAGSTLNTAAFVPPPPHEMMKALGEWENFIHGPMNHIPTLIGVGLAHAQFETIHPFLDGNGRVGRLLISFLLSERKILQRPLLYLSHYFKQHRDTYYELLQATRVDGDWGSWLRFFLDGVAEVSEGAASTGRAIVELHEGDRLKLQGEKGQGKASALRLLDHLYREPYTTTIRAAKILDMTYLGARKVIDRLVMAGILKQLPKRGRTVVFRYEAYLSLFET